MKKLSTSLVTLFFAVALLFNCDNKAPFESPQKMHVSLVQNTARIDEKQAQSWFEQNVNLPNKAARSSANKPIKKPNWEAVIHLFSTKRGWYLQIPISYENVRSLTYSDRKNGKNNTEPLPIPTEMLYIYRDSGRYNHYVVELLPDEEYVKKMQKKSDKIKIFNKREYSGYFLMKDWDDLPREGWYIKNGKVIRQLSPATTKKNGRQMGCEWFVRLHFSIGCVTAGGGEVVVFGTSLVIQGSDTNAGHSLANTIPKPSGYNCNFNSWQFTEADLFIDCSFDGDVPDPVEDFPFMPYLSGTGNPTPQLTWGSVYFINLFNLGFLLNSAEHNFYSTMVWTIPQAMNNRYSAQNISEENYCSQMDYFNGNAFKHAYWSALNTWSFGPDMARLMGQLHESSSDPLTREMDLHNNELGITIASGLYGQNEDVLTQSILNALSQGQGRRLGLYPDGTSLNFTIPTDGTNRCN